MGARERMLGRIRERQGKPPVASDEEHRVVAAHLAAHRRSPAPPAAGDLVALFRERALALASTCDEVAGRAAIPQAVAWYLESQSLARCAVCWPEFAHLGWAAADVRVEVRSAHAGDLVGITGVYCAIAETGTLMLLAGPQTPPTPSLLPETHVALVARSRIVASMEDAWMLVRREGGLPRSATLVSGPSRTADIEQTVTLGAHGPYRVHVVLFGT